MISPIISSLLVAAVGIMFIALSIPLIKERVPPNGSYGFRTRKTLSDPKIWYAANRASGKDLFVAGTIVSISSLVMLLFGCGLKAEYVVFTLLAVMVFSLIGALVNSYRTLKKM
ncbi:MAG: SdpI family protein [Pyrinomonadaceae bacterium]